MEGTLKLLKPLITDEVKKMSLEEMAEAYTLCLNPSILAGAFSQLYMLTISTAQKFYGISSHDLASFSLEKLDQCLQLYKQGDAKFSTYYRSCLYNRLREEAESLNTHKRRMIFCAESLDKLFEENMEFEPQAEISIEFKVGDFMPTEVMTEREITYCQYIIEGWANKDIAEMMQLSIMSLTKIRKRLREKIPAAGLVF